MSDARVSRLEDRLEALEQRFLALESRLTSETDTAPDLTPGSPAAAQVPAGPEGEHGHSSSEASKASSVSLLGRFLVILGGAFLIRAGTDAGAIPAAAGVTLGLTYGSAQLWLASRAAARGGMQSANWFGLGGAFIILPLIAESTLDFGILSPGIASVLLPVLGFAGVVVAFRHQLRPMAWAFLAGTGSVGLFLAARTGFGAGFPLGVLAVGLGGLWMGYLRKWYLLAIVGSVVPVAMVAVMGLLVALEFDGAIAASLSPAVALTLQLTLVAGFLGSYLARALRWSAPVGLPEMGQAVTAMFIGITGALVSAHKDPTLTAPFGIAMIATGIVCYSVSFLRIDRREGNRQNFAFFSTAALASTLTGSALMLDGMAELGLFVLASLTLAWFGARRRRATLSLHAAIYVLAAGFASGLIPKAFDALVGAAAEVPQARGLVPMGLAIVVGAICLAAPVAHDGKTWGRVSRLPKVLYLLFLLIAIDGLVVLFATARFAQLPEAGVDDGMVAAFRTGSLALSVVVIAYLSRWSKLREGARLVPLLLVLGGLALALGDLRGGRAATQFSSMALYGIALILAPRLARQARAQVIDQSR